MKLNTSFAALAFLDDVRASAVTRDSAPARADAPSFDVPIAKVTEDPKIDGTRADPARKQPHHVRLDWGYPFRRPAGEKTDGYIMADSQFVYVAMVAQPKEPVPAATRSNDVALGADGVVRVDFWPGGDRGFEYFFVATPVGTRNEFSSENSAF